MLLLTTALQVIGRIRALDLQFMANLLFRYYVAISLPRYDVWRIIERIAFIQEPVELKSLFFSYSNYPHTKFVIKLNLALATLPNFKPFSRTEEPIIDWLRVVTLPDPVLCSSTVRAGGPGRPAAPGSVN